MTIYNTQKTEEIIEQLQKEITEKDEQLNQKVIEEFSDDDLWLV